MPVQHAYIYSLELSPSSLLFGTNPRHQTCCFRREITKQDISILPSVNPMLPEIKHNRPVCGSSSVCTGHVAASRFLGSTTLMDLPNCPGFSLLRALSPHFSIAFK